MAPQSEHMDISVIVVTYNQQDTVGRTLDSILSQRFSGNYEIIIGDDCSADSTQAVCESYAERYPDKIRYFRRPENMGLVANYYDCIRRASGRYIADCAGDDFWVDDNKLQMQFDEMQADPAISMVTTDWMCCNTDGTNIRPYPGRQPITARKEFAPGELVVPILNHSVMPHLCSALYRRELVLKAMQEHPELMCGPNCSCEDLQVMVFMAAEGKIVMLPQVSTYYTLGHDSVSHSANLLRAFNHACKVVLQHRDLAEYFGVTHQLENFFKNKIDYLSALAFHSGESECCDKLAIAKNKTHNSGGFKGCIYKVAMANKIMWRFLRKIHRGKKRAI